MLVVVIRFVRGIGIGCVRKSLNNVARLKARFNGKYLGHKISSLFVRLEKSTATHACILFENTVADVVTISKCGYMTLRCCFWF